MAKYWHGTGTDIPIAAKLASGTSNKGPSEKGKTSQAEPGVSFIQRFYCSTLKSHKSGKKSLKYVPIKYKSDFRVC